MSKWFIGLLIPAFLLVTINLIPVNKGVILNCSHGTAFEYLSLKSFGLPFTYLNWGDGNCSEINRFTGEDEAIFKTRDYHTYNINPIAFIADVVIAVGILGAQGWLFSRYWRARP